jgi:hypothetical protein
MYRDDNTAARRWHNEQLQRTPVVISSQRNENRTRPQ